MGIEPYVEPTWNSGATAKEDKPQEDINLIESIFSNPVQEDTTDYDKKLSAWFPAPQTTEPKKMQEAVSNDASGSDHLIAIKEIIMNKGSDTLSYFNDKEAAANKIAAMCYKQIIEKTIPSILEKIKKQRIEKGVKPIKETPKPTKPAKAKLDFSVLRNQY